MTPAAFLALYPGAVQDPHRPEWYWVGDPEGPGLWRRDFRTDQWAYLYLDEVPETPERVVLWVAMQLGGFLKGTRVPL